MLKSNLDKQFFAKIDDNSQSHRPLTKTVYYSFCSRFTLVPVVFRLTKDEHKHFFYGDEKNPTSYFERYKDFGSSLFAIVFKEAPQSEIFPNFKQPYNGCYDLYSDAMAKILDEKNSDAFELMPVRMKTDLIKLKDSLPSSLRVIDWQGSRTINHLFDYIPNPKNLPLCLLQQDSLSSQENDTEKRFKISFNTIDSTIDRVWNLADSLVSKADQKKLKSECKTMTNVEESRECKITNPSFSFEFADNDQKFYSFSVDFDDPVVFVFNEPITMIKSQVQLSFIPELVVKDNVNSAANVRTFDQRINDLLKGFKYYSFIDGNYDKDLADLPDSEIQKLGLPVNHKNFYNLRAFVNNWLLNEKEIDKELPRDPKKIEELVPNL